MKLCGYPYNNDLVIRKDSPDYLVIIVIITSAFYVDWLFTLHEQLYRVVFIYV